MVGLEKKNHNESLFEGPQNMFSKDSERLRVVSSEKRECGEGLTALLKHWGSIFAAGA